MLRIQLFHLFLSLCIVRWCCANVDDCPNSGPKPWSPDWLTGDDLMCNCVVKDIGPTEAEREDFCTCNAYPSWLGREQSLDMEYITVMGKTLVIPDPNFNMSTVYKIQHSSDEMTELPSNLCNWDNSVAETYKETFTEFEAYWKHVVKIDFSWSNIKTLRDINCLERLYSLDLSRNQLTHISNTSFHNLIQLRHVDFSYNHITIVDPAITSADGLQLMFADMSHNDMTQIDVSNMHSKHPFCDFDYRNNEVTEIVNELKIKLDLSFGPGFVDLKNNAIKTFPDFKEILDLGNLAEIGKVMSFGFDLRGIPIVCDCNIQPFLALSQDIFQSLWRDYFNLTCKEPDEHAGKFVFKVPKDDLICPIEASVNTTIGCSYTDIPEFNTMLVNCSGIGLDKLPETMPFSKFSEYIDLDISNNHVTSIANVTYLNKLSRLDISNNQLYLLEHDAIILLENATHIDISNNPKLREIPQIFQYHNSCSINGQNDIFVCDCDTRWLISWLKDRQCGQETLFQCEVEGYGTMLATDFNESMLECEQEDTIIILLTVTLSGLMALLIVLSSLVYHFKYELLVLYLRFRRFKTSSVIPKLPYDVYIVYDEDNQLCRKWVTLTLVPKLEKKGYKLFLPVRDMSVCGVKSNAVIEILNNSRRFLFVLSDSYLDKDDEEKEWKYAWNLMKRDRMKKVVIVNYDFISSFDVLHPQIKAYLRVGSTVTFENWDRDIIPRIIQQLDPPCRPMRPPEGDISNDQSHRHVHKLFTTSFQTNKEIMDKQELNVETPKRDFNNRIRSAGSIQITEKKRPVDGPFQYYTYEQSKKCSFEIKNQLKY